MEEKKLNIGMGQISGLMLVVAALWQLIIVFKYIRWVFNYNGLLVALAVGFTAAVLLMQRRDNLLLISMGVLAVVYLLFGGIVGFVAVALLLFVALTLTTEYLPQAKELARKLWFVPAILMLLGGLISTYSFASFLWAVLDGGAFLLCGMWLAYPEGMPKKEKTYVEPGNEPTTVSAPDVEGYCELFKHVLLLLLTFGIWNLIWIYRMTRYLNRVGGEEERNPVTKLLLCIFVPFYIAYWTYKSAQRIDKLAAAVGVESKLSALCLILATFMPIIAPVVMQDKINTIIDVERGARAQDFDPTLKPIVLLNVAPESVDGYCGLFKHVLLMLLTCGIWNLIWIYRMTRYLNRVSGEEERNPVTKLLLCMFVPFYAAYWIYKSAQRIDKLGAQTGVKSNLAVLCLILCMVIGLVPYILMQDKVNEIIVAENSTVIDDVVEA